MDIIVTTPKTRMREAAEEAADCIAAGGGEYFRRFHSPNVPIDLNEDDRVFYVEDGFIRGFARVSGRLIYGIGFKCHTTGREYGPGYYVFMAAASWTWIKPIPMKGFQGFRYLPDRTARQVEEVGGWRDPKPATPVCG